MMTFDPSTLLSRTSAGDAELRTPQNGLSLAQRKLLTLLERPQALEEFAASHGIEPARLDRDLARLVAQNLVALNGETATPERTTVVLGGLRAPSSLVRLAFIPALVVMGGVAYYVVMPMLASKPLPAASTAASPPAVALAEPPAPPPVAVPSVAPIVVPLQVPAAASPTPAPHAVQAVAPPLAAAEPKAVGASAPEGTPEPKPSALAADRRHEEASRAAALAAGVAATAAPAARADPAPAARAPATPAPSAPTASSNAAAPMPSAATAALPPPVVAAAVPVSPSSAEAAPAPAKPAAPPSRAAASEPAKLAMAAPSTADAHPPARPKLVPVARQDPEFPREAIVRGIAAGDVKARLSIDAAGKVTAVDIVDARPARVFDRVVRDALSHWSFPAGANGRSTEVEIAFRRD